jgi:hypothetical protein
LGPKVTAKGIVALAQLEHLQEFLYFNYRTYDDLKINTHYYILCLRLLPWLQISCSGKSFSLHGNIMVHSGSFHKRNRRLPSQLGLRDLAINKSSGMPVGVALPNLKTLYLLEMPMKDFIVGTKLPSLTELVLYNFNQMEMEQILSVVGHQLHKLCVSVRDTLHLDSVFRMCPNLEVFYVPRSPSNYIGLKESLDDCNLSCITDLSIVQDFKENGDYVSGATLNSADFLQILRAALNLRILRWKNQIFSEQCTKEICLALELNSILQNLEQFKFLYEWPYSPVKPDLQVKKDCFSVIHCMIRHCSKLTTVQSFSIS